MTHSTASRRRRLISAAAVAASVSLLAACAGAGGNGGGDGGTTTLTLATVNNPQMKDMESLKYQFEDENPDIKVNFIQMEENDLRDAVTKDVATQGGQYDIATVGAYEVPIWAKNGWLTDLGPKANDDADYDVDDLFPSIKPILGSGDQLFAVPFYGESSLLMYRKDIFEAAGLTMPDEPTWDQVASLAKQLNDPSKNQTGICLRAKPGWGEGMASMTTVVNTFGGQWFDENWKAQVDQPAFTEAIRFYTDLLKSAGEKDPVSYGFTECLNLFTQGNAAMWYDATSAAGSVEDPENSKVAGKVGYVRAPVKDTDESGWLWSWNLAVPKTSKKQDAAWTFVKWATSKEYIKTVGEDLGWSRVPPASRLSTYDLPEYQKAAAAFAPITQEIMSDVDPEQPGTKPQQWVGIQYVGIPEWQDLGNQVSQQIADVIAGRSSLDEALKQGQSLAQKAGDAQQ
ncbi:ABC transporter substrate-binding protein [Solicola sp. PLA-1-18]|uniref:ABC transporter substrate-binding protein n=1 Tax=Solicola sp. PLA-1-18 TaxID=3380532 RepID=UPI003B78ACC8